MERLALKIFISLIISNLMGESTCATHRPGIVVDDRWMNYEDLFLYGKDAYLANDWERCAHYLEKAVEDYRFYNDHVTRCKQDCRRERIALKEGDLLTTNSSDEELKFFEGAVRTTLCLVRCKKKVFGDDRAEQVSPETLQEFESRNVYNYLQLCYHQLKEPKKAADAAYTHLISNPADEVMTSNLRYYLASPEVSKDGLVNLESESYAMYFLEGTETYRSEEWADLAANMERAVETYLEAEDRCRAACEKPFDMGWFPDFVTSISNHFTFCLRCKLNCKDDLANLNGEELEEALLPLMYHYLQIAYYKMGELRKACESASSYLLFHPDDEDMLANVKFYSAEESAPAEWFSTRSEAAAYRGRDAEERRLLEYIEEGFGADKDNGGTTHVVLEAFDSDALKKRGEDDGVLPPPPPRSRSPTDTKTEL